MALQGDISDSIANEPEAEGGVEGGVVGGVVY